MSTTKDGGPAFPFDNGGGEAYADRNGMSLRDYFAAKAMQAIISTPETISVIAQAAREAREPNGFKLTAGIAYATADAMLEARK